MSAQTIPPGETHPLSLRADEYGARADRVRIYVASWCVYCRQLEKFLKDNGVPYDRFDVDKDAIGKARYLQLGGGPIPIAEVNGTIVRGFSASEYRRLLRIK